MSKPAGGGGLLFKHILTKANLGDHVEEVTWDMLATCLLSLSRSEACIVQQQCQGWLQALLLSHHMSHLAADLL